MNKQKEYYIVYNTDAKVGHQTWTYVDKKRIFHMVRDPSNFYRTEDILSARRLIDMLKEENSYFAYNSIFDKKAELIKLDKSKFEIRKIVTKYCIRGKVE